MTVSTSSPDSYSTAPSAASATRKVSGWLTLGIVVMPAVFSWFTLRSGYSKTARTVALSWMVLFLLVQGVSAPGTKHRQAENTAATAAAEPTATQAAPRRESHEEQMARWIAEMRDKGGQCVMAANFVEQYVNQFGVSDWKVTKALEMASDKGCF